jgi:uncharacterized phage-associated protein
MTQEELEAWRHHPTTKKVFKLLKDYREVFKEKWAEGTLNEPKLLAHYQIRCEVFKELEEINYVAFCNLYGWEVPETKTEQQED